MGNQLAVFEDFRYVPEGDDGAFFRQLIGRTFDGFSTFGQYFEARETANKLGLEDVFDMVIPYVHFFDMYVSEYGKNKMIDLLISPADCLQWNEEYQLIDSILQENPDLDVALTAVYNNWKKGRYVLVHHS